MDLFYLQRSNCKYAAAGKKLNGKDYLQRLFITRRVTSRLTWDAILNSWSARALVTGGRLSRPAPFVNMAPNGTGSAAVTEQVYPNKDILERK